MDFPLVTHGVYTCRYTRSALSRALACTHEHTEGTAQGPPLQRNVRVFCLDAVRVRTLWH